MGYLYLAIVTLAFSFIGVFVKTAKLMVSAEIISVMRFAVGVLFLLVLTRLKGRRNRWYFGVGSMWVGGICKAINYIGENYAIAQGASYGNIVVWPVQTVVALVASVLLFHEGVTRRAVLGAALCIAGIGVICWNGLPLTGFVGENLSLTLMFVAAGIGASGFTIIQKLTLDRMDVMDTNLTMFAIGTLVTVLCLPFGAEITGEWHWESLFALLCMGVITGGGFLLTAIAMRTVPLYIATPIQSTAVVFTLLWGVLFYHEHLTAYTLAGTGIFMVGMLLINLKKRPRRRQLSQTQTDI